MARPIRLVIRLRASTKSSTAMPRQRKYSHWSFSSQLTIDSNSLRSGRRSATPPEPWKMASGPSTTFDANRGNRTARPRVMRARYRPRTRRAGKPTTTPTRAATSAATMIVGSKYQLYSVMRMPVVKAPTPKKAPWPIDTWPLNPVSRFRPWAAMAR
jgi:hypothetical protein